VSNETIDLLADRPDVIDEVGMMRWRERVDLPNPRTHSGGSMPQA